MEILGSPKFYTVYFKKLHSSPLLSTLGTGLSQSLTNVGVQKFNPLTSTDG